MKFKPAFILLFLFIVTIALSSAVAAEVSVGVKQGDWVEYKVTFTGTPPPEHDVRWARMEVTGVDGQRVNATFISQLDNGTMLNVAEDLDFSAGRLIDMFIIPAGLNAGDKFYAQGVANITIDDVSDRNAAGASRTVVHAEAEETHWYWDRTSGVVVEARTVSPVYTLNTVATSTGLWSPQILGLNQTVFFALAVLIAAVPIVAAMVLLVRRKIHHASKGIHLLADQQRLHYEERLICLSGGSTSC